MTPQDIADLLQREGSRLPPDKYDEASEPAEARQRRTELLVPVLSVCQHAWSSGSEEIDLLAEKLGDGSRDVAWRAPLGDSGILDFFLRVLSVNGLRQALQVHSLRLVGNSCADTDENRARVVQGNHLASIIHHLQYENLIPFTIPVLFNILVDYEPAQHLASQSYLNQRLTSLLTSASLANFIVFIPYFCKILALLITQDCEPALANPNTANILLALATSPPSRDDLDDFISLVSVATSYLADERFQSDMVQGPHLRLFLSAFYHAHTHFDMHQIDDPDTAGQLKQLRSSLLASLAEISGHDLFAACHPLQSQVPQSLLAWLQSANPHLQAAACLALGNLSRSDEVSVPLVQVHFAHLPLVRLLSNPSVSDAQLLHSALSFLKNLAIPAQNKAQLGSLLDPGCVPRIYGVDASPQVQFMAVSLTRLLLANCPPNVARICAPLSADPSSPAHERSGVSSVIALYDRSDAEPTRLEAARAIAAVCRVLHSSPVLPLLPDWEPSPEEEDERAGGGERQRQRRAAAAAAAAPPDIKDEEGRRRRHFYRRHVDMAKALAFLTMQPKWPVLRSEAWFVFALMCRSKEGAGIIVRVLQIHDAMSALIKAITGRDSPLGETALSQAAAAAAAEDSCSSSSCSPAGGATSPDGGQMATLADGLGLEPQQVNPQQQQQQENMVRIDRENALVMVTELLRTWGNRMMGLRLSLFQDLVKEGTEIVAAQRGAAAALQSGTRQ